LPLSSSSRARFHPTLPAPAMMMYFPSPIGQLYLPSPID
jgi:hypothetical protein